LAQPFTAARARNAGLAKLLELQRSTKYVQFVDGDCEVITNWLATAYQFLEENRAIAVVCGRRRERYPEQSIYNQLC
ncbi:glycosyltransferase family 2 protein, partial [Croceibacter atlanticus]